MFSAMKVHVMAMGGVFDTGLVTVLDTLKLANDFAASKGMRVPFDVRVVGVRRTVRTQQGFGVPTQHVSDVDTPELVIVPALGEMSPPELDVALKRRDVRDLKRWVGDWHASGARLAAACTGTFVLAATGLLDGLHATTSWWLAPDFRKRFPSVSLDDTRMVVEADGRITAGAALAHIDLALWLVREQSPLLARTTSRFLLFDGRPTQATYAMADHIAHQDPIVEAFELWARGNLRDFSMSGAAKAVGTSQRTLQRRVQQVLGCTPIHYVGDLRVDLARHRLETTDESIEEIAEAVGYSDGVTLRNLLRQRTGVGVRALRAQRME